MKSETTWLTAIQKKFKLLTSEEVKNKVDEFEIELVCRGKDKHEDMKDFKCHFCDWLEKNLRTINQPQASNRSPSLTSERWSGEKFVPKVRKEASMKEISNMGFTPELCFEHLRYHFAQEVKRERSLSLPNHPRWKA